jgi:two-component system chemotaxis response regulator CheV
MAMNNGILLESGTNELEVVEFCVDNGTEPIYFAVNVAKVREVLRKPKLTTIAASPVGVAGMIMLRDKVLPVIDLGQILGQTSVREADRLMVLEFNGLLITVLVNAVTRIYRMSWGQVEPPPSIASGSYITGLIKMDDRIIQILDFERIISEMYQEGAVKELDAQDLLAFNGAGKKILVADDSSFIRSQICTSLRLAGYTVVEATDGQDAWDYIETDMASSISLDAVITDVEMPKMDGLHLVTRIREQDALRNLPVYVFSSLASEDNIKKWDQLSINGILAKPDLPKLAVILGECLAGR